MMENTSEIKDAPTVEEFLKEGYTKEEIEGMSDEEFVYVAVALVDERSKEEIDEELKKGKGGGVGKRKC